MFGHKSQPIGGPSKGRVTCPGCSSEHFASERTAAWGGHLAKSSRSALDVAKGIAPPSAPNQPSKMSTDIVTPSSTAFNAQHAGHLMGKAFCRTHAPSYTALQAAPAGSTCDHVGCGGSFKYGAHPSAGVGNNMMKTERSALDVLKEMNSQETAAQGDPDDGGEGGHWCEHCKHTCRKPQDGKCPTCGHEVVAKSWESSSLTGGADIPLREGSKPSDHHMQLGRRYTTCPHCGQVHELIDEQTEQGQPSRKERQGADGYDGVATRKCIGAALDIFKEAWA
jgi:hypothetical protein